MIRQTISTESVPLWLFFFSYALMGPALAINAVLLALAIPSMSDYGYDGILVAAAIGAVIGLLPARWLARRIHEGLRE